MHTIKSLNASLLSKTIKFNHTHICNFAVLYPFALSDNMPVLEQEFYKTIGDYIDSSGLLDEAVKKDNAEYIVFGDAISPTGKPVSKLDVEITVGKKYKRLNVFGDRYWQSGISGDEISEPIPFTRMLMTYENAFGGKSHAYNDLGKGLDVSNLHGEDLHWLANIEDPDNPVLSRSFDAPVLGLAPIPLTWPQRQALIGTYDDNYINNHMPGLAPDIDWSYFNVAPVDQRLSGYWQGDEPFSITHMHEQHSRLQGHLPRVNARCFVFQQNPEYEVQIDKTTDPRVTLQQHPFITPDLGEFKEITLMLDTVIFFPNDDLGVLIHRGAYESQHPQGRDMLGCLLAHESFDEPVKDKEYFYQQFMIRTDPEEGYKYMMHSAPLIPYNAYCGFKKLIGDVDTSSPFADNFERYAQGQQKEAEAQIEAQIKALEDQGYTEEAQKIRDKMANPPTLDDLPEQEKQDVEKLQRLTDKIMPGLSDGTFDPKELDLTKLNLGAMDDLFKEMEDQAERKKDEALEELRTQIAEMESQFDLTEEQRERIQKLKDQVNGVVKPTPLPRFTEMNHAQVDEQIKEATKMIDEIDAMVAKGEMPELTPEQTQQVEQIREMADGTAMKEAMAQAEDFQFDGYRQGAHFIPDSVSPHPGEEPHRATDFIQRYTAEGITAYPNLDIAFCTITQQTLYGLNFHKALMEYTRWENVKFKHCEFDSTVVAHAHFINTEIVDCTLTGTNFGACCFEQCRLENLHFDDVTIAKSNFTDCEFINCTFDDRIDAWLETDISHCQFTDCVMKSLNFIELDMKHIVFTRCDLSESNFLQLDLYGSQFIESILKQTNFAVCMLVDCSFIRSELDNTRFVGPCNLCGSNFSHSQIHDANLAKAYLLDTTFDHADISQSNFAEAIMTNCSMVETIAQQTLFTEAQLDHANFQHANLFEANFMQASLKNTRFNHANMYSASLLDSTLADTDFMFANLQNTILKDWRPIRD